MKSGLIKIITVAMISLVSCKTLSDSFSNAATATIDFVVLPMANKELVALQMGIRDYRADYDNWPTDTSLLKKFLINVDSVSLPFQHYEYLSLKNELDSLKGEYILHYSSDSTKYRMLAGGFTMTMEADTAIKAKHYLVIVETSDGQQFTYPKEGNWTGYWVINEKVP